MQPPSVHGLRVHAVSYVARAARYITVQVRSQNSNPRSQEVVRSTRRERLTFARIALLAGGRVRDDADDGADCGRAQRVAGVCTSSCWATSRLRTPLIFSGGGVGALSQHSAALPVAISSWEPVPHCQQSWVAHIRQCGRQRVADTCAVHAQVHGCVCRVRRALCLAGTLWRFACW